MNLEITKVADQIVHQFKHPSIFKVESGKRVLVIAPHADDEVIGVGGTILRHRAKGNEVTVLFVTDGREGRKKKDCPEKTVSIRRDEALQACFLLDASCYFLEARDGQFLPEHDLIQQMKKLIEWVSPDYIYLPHYKDKHRDHFYTNLLFYSVCTDKPFIQQNKLDVVDVLAYEVWAPLEPNVFLDITNEFQRKKEIMGVYVSQLELVPYQTMMEGINQYRVSLFPLPTVQYVEAFYQVSCKRYIEEIQDYLKVQMNQVKTECELEIS